MDDNDEFAAIALQLALPAEEQIPTNKPKTSNHVTNERRLVNQWNTFTIGVKVDNLDLQKPPSADQLKVFFQYVAKHSKG